MEDLNGTAKVIGALFIGALVGGALGVLFAPEKGSRTRRRIIEGAKDLAEDAKEKMKDEAADLRKKADKLEAMAKEKIEDLKNNFKTKATEATVPQN